MSPAQRQGLAVAAGSALGALARLWVSVLLYSAPGLAFPWSTLTVNALGSLLIGACAALTAPVGRWPLGLETRLFLMGGFCGGFTTFSFFSLETLLLLGQGNWPLALLYVGLTLLLSLLAVAGGFRGGQLLQTQKSR